MQGGHTAEIRALEYAPDGRYIASAGKDSTIRLWSPRGTLIRSIDAGFWVNDLAISHDGRLIVAAGYGNNVAVWSVDGKLVKEFPMPPVVWSVAISPDGRYVAAGSMQRGAAIYALDGGEPVRLQPAGPVSSVEDVIFSRDGSRVITGHSDGKLYFWSRDGRLLNTVQAHEYRVNTLALSPDGMTVASAGIAGTDDAERDPVIQKRIFTKLWSLDGTPRSQFQSHSTRSLRFTPDGAHLVSGGTYDNRVLVHTLVGIPVSTITVGNSLRSSPARIALSPDGERIATADENIQPPGLHLWRRTGELEVSFHRVSGSMTGVAFSPDGASFVTTSQDERVRIWLSTGRLLASLRGHEGLFPAAVAFAPNGAYFATGAEEIILWSRFGEKIGTLPGHRNGTDTLAFMPDGRRLLSGGGDGMVQIVDVVARTVTRLKAHDGRVYAIAVHPSGTMFATGSTRLAVRIWNTDGQMLAEHMPTGLSRPEVFALQFSPDGKWLVAGTSHSEHTVRVLDLKGQLQSSIRTAHRMLNAGDVAVSPSGRFIAATVNRLVGIWRSDTRALVRTLRGHTGDVRALAFSPNERHLVTVAHDGRTRLWRLDTGDSVTLLAREDDWIAYSDDGYFDASHYGGELVAMVRGLDAYGVDQFALGRNRPDTLLTRLGLGTPEFIEHLKLQYERRLKRSGVGADPGILEMEAPEVRLTSARQDGKHVELEAAISDGRNALRSYQVFVNHVPLFPGLGKPLEGRQARVRERVELGDGANKVEISAYNSRGVEALRAAWTGTYRGAVKGNLYFIGFGVSRYRNRELNLRFAHKDVLDLGALVQRYQGDYGRVVVKTYVDEAVTMENIRGAKDLLREATVDDTVILFVAGHGAYDLSKEATYYYAPFGLDVRNLAGTGVPFESLESVLADIAPRRKLMLLDTCESGEMDPVTRAAIEAKLGTGVQVRTSDVMRQNQADRPRRTFLYDRDRYIYNDLARRTGAVVFSASHAGELSFESPAIENGFFTQSILDALAPGGADANKDGTVSMDELQSFVSLDVALRTGGAQRPTVDRDNIYQQFGLPVAR